MAEPTKTVQNERTKLTAAWLNTMGAGSVVVGFISPIVAQTVAEIPRWPPVFLSFIWFLGGGALHLFARALLGSLSV